MRSSPANKPARWQGQCGMFTASSGSVGIAPSGRDHSKGVELAGTATRAVQRTGMSSKEKLAICPEIGSKACASGLPGLMSDCADAV